MTHNLLKGKRGIIFGALNEESIAWKVAVKAAEEGTIEGYERIAILVSTLESDTILTCCLTTICCPLTLTESRNSLTDLVQTDEVLSYIVIQSSCYVTCSLILTEVCQ